MSVAMCKFNNASLFGSGLVFVKIEGVVCNCKLPDSCNFIVHEGLSLPFLCIIN